MDIDVPLNPSTSEDKHRLSILEGNENNMPSSCDTRKTPLTGAEYLSLNNSRKRYSDFNDDHASMSMDISDNIRLKPDIVTFARTPGIYKYRRRVSTEPKIDFFSVFNIPTHVIHVIFSFLNKKDLVNAMSTCCRFYVAGLTAPNWMRLDLYQRTIPENTLLNLLSRKTRVARLSETMITPSIRNASFFTTNTEPLTFMLTHLDIGRASFPSIDGLITILSACRKLKALSLESQSLDDDGLICEAISMNRDLDCLDLSMVSGFDLRGIEAICIGCRKLRFLNMSWVGLGRDCIASLCRHLPDTITHLNLSGSKDRNSISDQDVESLCASCPSIVECDLSDNVSITDVGLEAILGLENLQVLSLSRCYGIDPFNFMSCGHLHQLNIFGTMTEDGERVLKLTLPGTQINTSVFNHIAKPTVPPSVSSIWNQKTRD
ncbi:unnamed protein product [Auanema sp. JU1783]|nr:unnamed protein product [Auanema sp. JU1783]